MVVKDEFRTHPDSFVPGGVTICVLDINGLVKEYDKVKKTIFLYESSTQKSNGS